MDELSTKRIYENINRCLNQSLNYLELALDPKNNDVATTLIEIAKTYRETADIYMQTAEIQARNDMKRIELTSRLEKILSSGILPA